MAQTSLNSTGVASSAALSLQSNGTTEAIGISTGQVATLAQNPILTSGTVNGLAFLNASKVLTTGSALTFDGATSFALKQNTGGTGNYSEFVLDITNSFSGTGKSYFRNISLNGGNSSTALAFGVNADGGGAPSEGMRLTSTGLGIGVTSPARKLSVSSGSTSATYIQLCNTTSGTGVGQGFELFSDGTNAGIINRQNGFIEFDTNNIERARIDSSGNLLVGKTAANTNTAGTEILGGVNAGIIALTFAGRPLYINRLSTDGQLIQFDRDGTTVGSISVASSITSYNVTSDQRLKENIQDAVPASALIDALQVRQYDWKKEGTHQRYGFVAQELVAVAPEAVYQPVDPDEMMAVDYSKLVPMLVKEIQSLRQRVAQLESN